ncbi:glycosyltransferase [Vibrio alginolyticus]|uniref:glycosyltransferase n=1 Tax=Vibrio alginolyticus TaxID=663 RepID=UPI0021D11B30
MNKISLIIFNKNYEKYQSELIDSLEENKVFNNNRIQVFFCDDGSNDSSVKRLEKYIAINNIFNLKIVRVSPFNTSRSFYSHGQLEGLKLVIDSYKTFDKNSYFFLLDSDDVFSADYIEKTDEIIKVTNANLIFGQVEDFDSETKLIHPPKVIVRKVDKNPSIWPTVVLTSAIVVSYEFINKNYEAIFDMTYKDVWLDSRLNILGLNDCSGVVYSGVTMYRRIHSNNDSRKMDTRRKVVKQIEAASYFGKYVSVKTKFNLRRYMLEILDKWIKK